MVALAAAVLLGVAAPGADARVSRVRPYRVGGPVTLDTDLRSSSGASAWAVDAFLQATTPLPPLGAAFVDAERAYSVNARFLLAAALHESGWGTSAIARIKHNLFGFNAFDRDPFRSASAYDTYAANIDATAKFIRDAYLTPGGLYWGGAPTLRSMQQYWSSSGTWGLSVSRLASSIRLDTIEGATIRASAPVVRDVLHGGDTATVQLAWTGGPIPAGVEFTAAWTPIQLDADLIAAAASATASAGGGDAGAGASADAGDAGAGASADADEAAVSREAAVAPDAALALETPDGAPSVAQRLQTGANSIAFSLQAPVEPGTYLLELAMRDADGRPLPAPEQIAIPAVEVRVWGDRSVRFDIDPSPDGTGAVVRLTNTGREPVPADWRGDDVAGDPQAESLRSTVTVTAAADDPAGPTQVRLLAAPLTEDLEPGASLAFEVPGIAAATGRSSTWLSASLSIAGDPSWLAAYVPAGGWFAEGAAPPVAGARAGAVLFEGGPTGQPAAVVPPAPSPASQQVPPAPPQQAPPAIQVTTTYGEHDGSVAYQGSWGDAPSPRYIGGSVAWSKSAGSSATFTFSGTSVTWIGPVGPTRGLAQVLLDGRPVARVSLWRPSFTARGVLYQQSFAATGPHTLTITVLPMPSHPYVAIDAFIVRS